MKRALPIIAGVLVAAVLVVGLLQASDRDEALPTESGPGAIKSKFDAARAERALAGAPAPLAALHADANKLLGGGKRAVARFEARLRELRGYPVVVNKWGSWCAPCRAEFPHFQVMSVRYGRQVAFIGVNTEDTRAHAAGFLRRFPVPFPSYVDRRDAIGESLRAAKAAPVTVYIDRAGEIDYVHTGYYKSEAALERDIKRYALG